MQKSGKKVKLFDDNECPICYSSPQVKKAHPDSCGHVFCHQCLEKCASQCKKVCPVCQAEFSESIRKRSPKSKLISRLKKAGIISLGVIATPVAVVLGTSVVALGFAITGQPLGSLATLVAGPIFISYKLWKKLILPQLRNV